MNELALQFYNQAPPVFDPEWKYASLDKCLNQTLGDGLSYIAGQKRGKN